MNIDSPRFGTLEVDEEMILHLERGMPGFPDCTQFIVMDHDKETPFKWLQSIDRPEVAFLVVEPEQVMRSYQVDVPTEVLSLVQWDKDCTEADIAVFVILNVEDGNLTANLRAPVIVNISKRVAFQMIIEDPEAPVRAPIGPKELTEPAESRS